MNSLLSLAVILAQVSVLWVGPSVRVLWYTYTGRGDNTVTVDYYTALIIVGVLTAR
jgi:hypothetical protein